jgi:parallel beta-helix repeat protein
MKSTVYKEGFSGMSGNVLQIILLATFAIPFARADEARPATAPAAVSPATPSDRPIRVRKECMVTVGQTEGDLKGKDDKIIQAAVDYVTRLGGGTVRVLPGVYELHNAVRLRPHITLQGSGAATVLRKAACFSARLAQDADFCEWGVAVQDVNGFHPNDGIMVRAKTGTCDWQYSVLTATIMRIEGNVLFLDQTLKDSFGLYSDATVATIFPLLTAEKTDDVVVKDLVLDGNGEHNERIHGNFSGAVFLADCDRWLFTNVVADSYNGDGFSYQSCDDLQFQDCTALNNAGYGFHPGSGAQRTILRHCTATGNGVGIYVCWGVSDASIEDCTLSQNWDYGISIGYRDTDNTVRNCTLERNGKAGILFRDEGTLRRCSSRAQIVGCTISDNGRLHSGIGIEIQGPTRDITIADSHLTNTANGNQWTGICIGNKARDITLNGNTFEGCVVQVDDRR